MADAAGEPARASDARLRALVGFVDNKVWMSEPCRSTPSTRPTAVTSEHDIVGLGVIDTIVVACTKGRPMMWQAWRGIHGADPHFMRSKAFPCLSKRSIVDGDSVLYASTEGPVEITSQGASLAAPMLHGRRVGALRAGNHGRRMFDGLYFLVHGTDGGQRGRGRHRRRRQMVRFHPDADGALQPTRDRPAHLVINNLLLRVECRILTP